MVGQVRLMRNTVAAFAFLLSALLFVIAASCDGEGKKTGPSPWAPALMERIPDGNYSMLGYGDLESFLESEFGSLLLEFFPSIEGWTNRIGIKTDSIERLAFAAYPPKPGEQHGAVIMVVEGTMTEDKVLNLPGLQEVEFEKQQVSDYTIYSAEGDFSMCFPDESTMILGSTALVRKSLALEEGEGDSLADGRGLENFRRYLRQADDFVVVITDLDRIITNLSSANTLLKRFEIFQAGVVGMDVEQDLKLRIMATCDTDENAKRVASGFQGLVGILIMLVEKQEFTQFEFERVNVDGEVLRGLIIEMLESVDARSIDEEVIVTAVIPQEIIDLIAAYTHRVVERGRE